jgi:hypothetical protein
MDIALVIAVENYSDSKIPTVKYAQNDAEQFSLAIKEIGFVEQVVLLSSQATKSTIESKLRKTALSLTEDDRFFFFYAGHSFSENDVNFVTCFDTQPDDLAATSIDLQWLMTWIRKSPCKQSAIFLDSCASGLLADADLRSIYGDLAKDELAVSFEDSERCVGFASCRSGQESWVSGQVKHGAWAFHVIQAFRGNAKVALEQGYCLTSGSLQEYLSRAVQKTLRDAYSDKKDQTPWTFGSTAEEFVLADLTELFDKRKKVANPYALQVVNAKLLRTHRERVKILSGFQRHHRVPELVTESTESFVASISSDEITQVLETKFKELRSRFGFKRADLTVANEGDGHGTIITPYFNYSISVGLDPDDSTNVIWRREVDAIKEPNSIFSEEFSEVFGREFDTVQFSLPNSINLDDLIDQIEALEDDTLSVSYDMNATNCFLSVDGVAGKIEVTSETLSIVKSGPMQPGLILESFFAIQKALIDTHGVRAISFAASSTA